jgi:nucleolysin TIA-1/TIAR
LTLNGRQMFGQPIKVNWAYVSGQREDTTGYLQSLVSFVYAMND